MQAAKVKTELVDLKVLNGQGDKRKSDELMRHVATLFSLTANHCTEEQVQTYDWVMQRLADLVCAETRKFAAEKLCRLDNAPQEIVRRFAFDVIDVADPILRHSPVLSDQDLVQVSEAKGEEHMVSICMRRELSCVVTDVLIRSEHGSVLIKLAANANAEISAVGMSVLNKAACGDQSLAREIAQRKCANANQISAQGDAEERRSNLSLSMLWQEMAQDVEEKYYDLSKHSYLARYRFDPSLEKTARLDRQGLLDKGILRQFAANDQFADVVCGIARMSGFPHQIVARMMACPRWDQVLCLFKLLGFSDRLLQELLECGPWMLCLSPNQCSAIVQQYRDLTVEKARSHALLWQQDGLLLD